MSKFSSHQRRQYIKRLWHPSGINLCFYCHELIPRKLRSLDHLIPHSRGGGVSQDNIVLCCRFCNNAKADMTLAEFVDFCANYGGISQVKENYGHSPHSRVKEYNML